MQDCVGYHSRILDEEITFLSLIQAFIIAVNAENKRNVLFLEIKILQMLELRRIFLAISR